MQWFFVFFFISGFCSLLYEIVWLRLAMTQFGVTSALVAIVLSVFMAGLGLGSWASGRLITRYGERVRTPALRFYALTEMLIGISALLVPYQLMWGRDSLRGVALSSSSYYLASGLWIALTLVPWCACMGATIPIAMLAIRRNFQQDGARSFSYLYVANVCGAVAGALLPPLLVELRGFHGTLRIGAFLNLALSAAALALTRRARVSATGAPTASPAVASPSYPPAGDRRLLILLFTTGLTSMGMEVVWIRQFTPYLGTAVYAFASILGLYLAATFIGSRRYRLRKTSMHASDATTWALLGLFALLPVLTADPYIPVGKVLRLLIGIAPFSGVLGFVTPQLVDRWSQGDPDRAGSAYAINVVGCILGPLLAGFVLLPLMSERWVLLVLAVPWLALAVLPGMASDSAIRVRLGWRRWVPYAVIPGALAMVLTGRDYYDYFSHRQVLRDHTATVVAIGEGMQRRLLVNGIGMTLLHPVTKMMAHLPLASLSRAPKSALVVCFGMGTTYRSALSWGIPTTVVELVPSVPRLFPYYHSDAKALMQSPLSRIVIDDGRRYLERAPDQFDVITLDPPPPIQAAGSSLLYSEEFYKLAKRRLRPGGILQTWLPSGDAVVRTSVTRALVESFAYVRVFHTGDTAEGGFQYLASDQALPTWTAKEMAEHMPAQARQDLLEWNPQARVEDRFARALGSEVSLDSLMDGAPWSPALQDDRPENEYYVLRQWLPERNWHYLAGSSAPSQKELLSGD